MGNCCCRPGKSSMVWAGDVWDNFSTSPAAAAAEEEEPKKSHQNTIATSSSSSSSYSGAVREVKIRITQKELQELVQDANVEGVPVEQVLTRLITNETGHSHQYHHQHPWKPTLNSIPE